MTKRSKLILLDAVVVISAHEQEYWEHLCHTYQVAIPATIRENELFHFHSDRGVKRLESSSWVAQGKVHRLEANMSDYDLISKKLVRDFRLSLDKGELEALAILMSKTYEHCLFTTADRAAIKALGVLNIGHRGVSVEELLIGSKKSRLPIHLTKKWFQNCITEGFREQHLWLQK